MDDFWRPGLTLADVERLAILGAFRFFRENKSKTALALDIAVRTLDNKLEIYNGKRTEIQTDNLHAEPRIPVEPVVEATKEQPMPVRKRKEIQKMSSECTPESATNSGKG